MSEKWRYGEGTEYTGTDPKKINPRNLKLKAIPEEWMCPLCDVHSEFVFPVTDIAICADCFNEIKERKEVAKRWKNHLSYPNKTACLRCGKPFIGGVLLSTHICTKCTKRAGKIEQANRVRRYARKVA